MIFKIRSAYYQTKYQAALLKTFFCSGDNSIGHFGKYHNTLCLSPQSLHKHCFCFLLGPLYVPRGTGNNAYVKFGGTNKEYYGIFRSGLLKNKHTTETILRLSQFFAFYNVTARSALPFPPDQDFSRISWKFILWLFKNVAVISSLVCA